MRKLQSLRVIIQILCIIGLGIGLMNDASNIMIAVLFLGILMGPIYCGFVCPFGFIQDMSARIGRGLGIKRCKLPKSLHRVLISVRYIVFGLGGIIGVSILLNLLGYDPRANILNLITGKIITIGSLVTIIVFIILGLFYDRPFCNYLCYKGAEYSLRGAFRVFRIRRDKDICIGCELCDKACPMNIDISSSEYVNSLQCINCYSCISSCPKKGALSVATIGSMFKNKGQRLTGILILAISIGFCGLTLGAMAKQYAGDIETYSLESDKVKQLEENSLRSGLLSDIDDGIYTGSAEGFKGQITSEVKVEKGVIVSIVVTESSDDRKWFMRAYEPIVNSILDTQSTEVDTISSATYSSVGIINSVKDALGFEDKIILNKPRRRH